MADMILVRDAAEKWGLSERRVASLCASGMIEGALRKGHVWMIPSDAQRPVDGRLKEQKNLPRLPLASKPRHTSSRRAG